MLIRNGIEMKNVPDRIFLIGYMGSGKTTISKILSKTTSIPVIDMDQEIESAEGLAIRKIFIKYGEHEFRNKESELLDKLCHVKSGIDLIAGETTGEEKVLNRVGKYDKFGEISGPLIISCGGGIILDELNRAVLKDQCTIFLEANPRTLFDRVNGDENRPFAFMDIVDEQERLEKFLELYKKRVQLYYEAASLVISTDEKSPIEIGEEILTALA